MKTPWITILALATFTMASTSHAQPPEVGRLYKLTPDPSCESHRSGMLETQGQLGIDLLICDQRLELWLSENTTPNAANPVFKVIDHARVGQASKYIMFNIHEPCIEPKSGNTKPWFVVLDYSRKPPYSLRNQGIVAAWRVNAMLKRLELVPPREMAKIICVPEVDPE